MKYWGRPLPAFFLPLVSFALWLYLFFSYLPTLQSNLDFTRQNLLSLLFISNLILVLAWFLSGQIVFIVFASVFILLTSYLILHLEEGGLWIQTLTIALLFLWLRHLSHRIQKEKLDDLVLREKIQGERNLAQKTLEEKGHLLSALTRKLRRLHYLREFSDHLKDKTQLNVAAQTITEEIAGMIPQAEHVLLYIMDEKTHELGLVAHYSRRGPYGVRDKMGNEYDRWVLSRSQAVLITDATKDFRFVTDSQTMAEFRSVCLVPLVSERRVFGVIHLNATDPGKFSTDDLRLLDIVGNLTAVTFRNILLYDKTEELAIVDSLTECYLNRHVQERLQQEVYRSLRDRSPFAVLMADIDHFKRYNDEYGHTAGDLVLKEIAQILKASVGPSDIVGRYGGEEFLLILPQKEGRGAFQIAEGIRQKIEDHVFRLRREERRITISFGIAVFPRDGQTKDELIWKADQHLYEAKREGRNRVSPRPVRTAKKS